MRLNNTSWVARPGIKSLKATFECIFILLRAYRTLKEIQLLMNECTGFLSISARLCAVATRRINVISGGKGED
jgi:hypothetical protein